MMHDPKSPTPAEASAGRCHLCHRSLVSSPPPRAPEIERLGEEWGGAYVHRSCAVLAGLVRPVALRRRDEPQPVTWGGAASRPRVVSER